MTTLEIESAQAAAALADDAGISVLHSHHYHSVLLRVLYEAEGIDAAGILSAAATTAGMETLPSRGARGQEARNHTAAEAFRLTGLGKLELAGVDAEGTGEALVLGSHFASAWISRYPASDNPVCAATNAFLSAALSTAYGRRIDAHETACAAQGASACGFRVRPIDGVEPADGRVRSATSVAPAACEGSLEGFDGLLGELFGGGLRANDSGTIQAPGGPFARLPADFYAGVTEGFEREIPRVRGAKFAKLPGILLLEAAHRNAFHLFGEILYSPAWTERVGPCLGSMEERLHFLLGVIEALGWGSWEVMSFAPGERLIARVSNSYEAVGHTRLFGRSRTPRCHVARGAAAALMNLLFRDEVSRGPALTASHYNQLFRSPDSFRAVETRCRALGDACCEIVANPLTL